MTYLELITAIADAERECGISDLDPISREILKIVASSSMSNTKVRMKDLIKVGTFPTLQSHVTTLVEAGWIERHDDEGDKRVTLLRITPKSLSAFQRISDKLHEPPGITKRDQCTSCLPQIREKAFAAYERKFREFEVEFKEQDQL